MHQLNPYLSFSGNCQEAMSFYQNFLGGELAMQRFADSPLASHVPAEVQQYIVHSTLTSDALTIMASDASGMRGPLAVGENVALCLNCSSDEEITRLFITLSEGGSVQDPLAVMFWGSKFGALPDQFGTK